LFRKKNFETKKEEDLAAIKFTNLTLTFMQRIYDIKVDMKLESLKIDDYCHQTKKYILISNIDQNLKSKIIANINYIYSSKYSDKYIKEASNYIISHFQGLIKIILAVQVYFDPITLSKIVEFGYDVYNSLKKSIIRPKTFIAYIKKEMNINENLINNKKEKRPFFYLKANMDAMILSLIDYGTNFAR
jgi:hypothetical protein